MCETFASEVLIPVASAFLPEHIELCGQFFLQPAKSSEYRNCRGLGTGRVGKKSEFEMIHLTIAQVRESSQTAWDEVRRDIVSMFTVIQRSVLAVLR